MTSAMRKYMQATAMYLKEMEADHKATLTIKSYSECLNAFSIHMEENGFDKDGPNIAAMMSFKQEMAARGLKSSSIHQYLTILHTFFEWASDPDMGYYERNPVSKRLIPPKKGNGSKPYENLLTEREILDIISGNKPKWLRNSLWTRNRAMTIVFLSTGIRNNELCALTLSDVDFDKSILTVRNGKGGKYRIVQLPKIVKTTLLQYLADDIRPKDAPKDAPLFGTMYGGEWHALDRIGLTQVIERHIKGITGREGIRSHALRHANASLMLSNGVTMEDIQLALGHTSLVTTEIYAQRLSIKAPEINIDKIFGEMAFQAAKAESAKERNNTESNANDVEEIEPDFFIQTALKQSVGICSRQCFVH